MTSHQVNGITLEVERHGAPDRPAFVLVRGLGTQLTAWPSALIEALCAGGHGYQVVTFDNRDVGLSQKFEGRPDLGAIIAGEAKPPYTIADMATDCVGVMDACELTRAHVVGISLGGAVVQHVAAAHADRCLSVSSIMSTSGAPGLPRGRSELLAALAVRPPDLGNREAILQYKMERQRLLSTKRYAMGDQELRTYCETAHDRCDNPAGNHRQLAAMLADGSRVEMLKRIRVPALVIHGTADPLIPLAAGQDTASHIRGAKFEEVAEMGHEVSEAGAPVIAQLLLAHAGRG